MYADLSNTACDTFSIIRYTVRSECRFLPARDVIGWRQSITTAKTLREKVIVRQFSRANNGTLALDNPLLDPTSTDYFLEMKREVKQKKLHRMAKAHEFW
jgi:hypothetical protein